ncbi:hypothetical protein LguiB_032680 [Lonicera macranthoides]
MIITFEIPYVRYIFLISSSMYTNNNLGTFKFVADSRFGQCGSDQSEKPSNGLTLPALRP